jgi:hypothetical protein
VCAGKFLDSWIETACEGKAAYEKATAIVADLVRDIVGDADPISRLAGLAQSSINGRQSIHKRVGNEFVWFITRQLRCRSG